MKLNVLELMWKKVLELLLLKNVLEGVLSEWWDQCVESDSAALIGAPRGGVEYQILENKIWKNVKDYSVLKGMNRDL